MVLIHDFVKDAAWQRLDVWRDFHVKLIEFVVPMPDFRARAANKFEGLDNSPSHDITKSIHERFPYNPGMPSEHPAFHAVLSALPKETLAHLSPIDWNWHRIKARQARIIDEAFRVFQRGEIERALHELHAERENRRIYDLRQAQFQKAKNNAVRLSKKLEAASMHAQEQAMKLAERGIMLRDELAWKRFMQLYLKEFGPSQKNLKYRTERAQIEPSLAEIRIAQDLLTTPLELVIEIAHKMLPIEQRDLLNDILKKYTIQLNSIDLRLDNLAKFKLFVSKVFYSVFVAGNSARNLSESLANDAAFARNEREHFLNNKTDSRNTTKRQLLHDRLLHLHHQNKLFDVAMDHIGREQQVDNKYIEHHQDLRSFHAKMDKLQPITIEGKTEFVQLDPAKFRTQYSVVKHWIDTVDQLLDVPVKRAHEHAEMQLVNQNRTDEWFADLNDIHRANQTVEAYRMMNAHRIRDFMRSYDLRDAVVALNTLANAPQNSTRTK